MLVSQLIQILEKLPAHLDVFIDVSPLLSEYWMLSEVGGAEEIQIVKQGQPIVLISRLIYLI